MDDIQLSSSPKSKMASSYRLRCLSWVLETNLKEEVCRGFIFANLFYSLYLSVRLWWNILVANLATNFQDLVAKGKNLVALAPVLGAISRPVYLRLARYVNNNLTMKGFYSTPHVSCTKGFYFQRGNGEQLKFTLELSGIVFQETPLNCNNCLRITIHNCSFHNASRALAIKIQNIGSFHLDLQGRSKFRNNFQCIHVLLLYNT